MSGIENIYFPISALMISVLIIIVFFRKKRIKNIETSIYKFLIITNILEVILACAIIITALVNGSIFILSVLDKIDYMLILTWVWLLFCYIYMISFNNKKVIQIAGFINLIIYLLIAVTDITIVNENGIMNSYGPSNDILFVSILIYVVFIVIFVIKGLIKKVNKEKYIPIVVLLSLIIAMIFIRIFKPELVLLSFIISFINLVMYHTIENPDVKLLNEYIKNKELAQTSIQEKSNTLFKVSQDVKNPISKIVSLSNKLLESNDIKEIHNEAKNIVNEARNVTKVINNVLDITQMDIDNVKIADTSYNIYNLFNQIIYLTKNKVNENVEYKYNINDTIPINLRGDSTKLKQAICSIIFNAMKNTEKGFVDLDIDSIIKYDLCRLIITISDSGKGMELDKINEILESDEVNEKQTYRLDNLDIDLKVAKKIINLMGGNLLIKSEVNQGTSFTIIVDQIIENNIQESNVELEKLTLNISNKRKVIVVNDNYQELGLLSNEFKKNNINVIRTMNGKDCVDKIKNGENFDLILIDDEMEPMNAIETLEQINKLKKENIKVVVMLGKGKESFKDNYLEDYSFVDYLLKNDYENEIKRIKENHL